MNVCYARIFPYSTDLREERNSRVREGVIQLRACMQERPRRRRKRGEPSAHRYARTALSTAASRPARMALGAAAEERFISVLFNSPAAPSFMHVTTLP